MEFFDKVVSFFTDKEEGSYDGEGWIDINIRVMSPFSELVSIKRWLEPFAEELGWEIQSGNEIEEIDVKRVNITLKPKENKKFTPKEFLENKDKLFGLTYAIHRELLCKGNEKKAQQGFREQISILSLKAKGAEPKKSDWIVLESASFLNYRYNLAKRINFEKKNKEKAIELFSRTVEEDVKSLFSDEEPKESKTSSTSSKKSKEDSKFEKDSKESSKKMKQELKDLFELNL